MGTVGYFFGALLATAGIGYIWLGLLWLVRVRKRWPRFAIWSAIAVAAMIGALTAAGGGELVVTLTATGCAVAFMVWRAKRELFTT